MAYLNGKELLFSPHVHIDPASKTKLQAAREEGKTAGLDEFWNTFQGGGEEVDYTNAFRNYRWNDACFNPVFSIKANGSKLSSAFQTSIISDTKVPIFHSGGSSKSSQVFYGAQRLKTIRELNVVKTTTFSQWFQNCTALENVGFKGEIGNALDLHWSTKLSKASIESVINALSDTVEGMPTVTFSKTAVENAFPKVDCLAYAVYAESQTKDGLTITNNGDGSFTLNGTYNGTDGFPLFFNVATIDLPFATYGTYILSLEGGKVDGIEDVYTRGGLNLMWGENPLEKPSGDTIYMNIVIPQGATFDNGTIHPTLVCDEWHTFIYHPNHFWTISLV